MIGEAGVGKSTLLRQLLPEVRLRGAVMVTGRALETREPRPVRTVGGADRSALHELGLAPARAVAAARAARARAAVGCDAWRAAAARRQRRGISCTQELVAFLRAASEVRPIGARARGHALGRRGELGRAGVRARAAHDGADLHRPHRAQRGGGVRRGARAASAALARRARARAAPRATDGGRGARVACRARCTAPSSATTCSTSCCATPRAIPFLVMQLHAHAGRGERVQLQRQRRGCGRMPESLDAAGRHVGPRGATPQRGCRPRRCASSSRPRRSGAPSRSTLLADAASVSLDAVLDAIDSGLAASVLEPAHDAKDDTLPVRARPARGCRAQDGEPGAPATDARAHRRPARGAHARRGGSDRVALRAQRQRVEGVRVVLARRDARDVAATRSTTATEFLQLALEHAADDEERFAVHDELARAAELSGRWADVERSCDAMLAMLASVDDARPRAARAAAPPAGAGAARPRACARWSASAASCLPSPSGSAPSRDVVRMRSLLVQTLQRLGRVDEAVAHRRGVAAQSRGGR